MRVGFRAVRDRFAHIDGVLEDLRFSRSEPSFVAIRFYPWWEHPRYLAARAAGRNWRIEAPPDEAARVMTVLAIDPVHFTGALPGSVEDIAWHESGPSLWPFETDGRLFVNDPVPDDVVPEIARRADLSEHDLAHLHSALARTPPYALDQPPAIHAALRAIFTERGVHHLATHDGKPSGLVAFHFHDSLLVARDFEVDVPDWEHRDEWVP